MTRFDAILFDLGNTLLYFDGDWADVFARSDQAIVSHLKAIGLDLEEQRFMTEFRARLTAYYLERESEFIEHTTGYILQNLLQAWGFDPQPETTLNDALRAMYKVSQAHWRIETDTHAVLTDLKSSGYKLGIISNAANDADVQTLVDNANIRPYFDFILSSAACGIRKPNPQIFNQALSHWQIDPHRTAIVGDTLNADILGAHNAGLFGIWITHRADTPGNHNHKDTIIPDATIETLSELPALLADYK